MIPFTITNLILVIGGLTIWITLLSTAIIGLGEVVYRASGRK